MHMTITHITYKINTLTDDAVYIYMHVINIFLLLVQFLGRKLFSSVTRLISKYNTETEMCYCLGIVRVIL